MGKCDEKLILQICTVIIACLLFAIAIYRFTFHLDYLRHLLCAYFLFFAILLVLAEFLDVIRNLFTFLSVKIGKGIFIIFVGILIFDLWDDINSEIERMSLSFGIIITTYGLFLVIYGLIKGG